MGTCAKNGAAIIDGNVVPPTEVLVLRTLVTFAKSATVPEIALAMNERVSDASLYTLLKRLAHRQLVTRKETIIPPTQTRGRSSSRVFWSPSQATREFFENESSE